MRFNEIIAEKQKRDCIVVDVQPEYSFLIDFEPDLMEFLNYNTNKILMYYNSDEEGFTNDSLHDIMQYWEDHGFDPENWQRVEMVDKGYGYFRSWMDEGVSERAIIDVIRMMYQQRVNASGELFKDKSAEYFVEQLTALGIPEEIISDHIIINWTSVAKLKQYSGSYIVGGGRRECLREVELLMNAFNIKYKEIARFIYGD